MVPTFAAPARPVIGRQHTMARAGVGVVLGVVEHHLPLWPGTYSIGRRTQVKGIT